MRTLDDITGEGEHAAERLARLYLLEHLLRLERDYACSIINVPQWDRLKFSLNDALNYIGVTKGMTQYELIQYLAKLGRPEQDSDSGGQIIIMKRN
jgi:hypothetical protein